VSSHLPSIACLRAAEAVARHCSFSRAAIELNLTQTAISHQIRKLESLLGTQLFLRNAGTVRLTPRGKEYLADIRPLIVGIAHATDRLASAKDENALIIGCPGTFLLKCLAPIIGRFIERHPHIDVRIRTLDPYGAEERDHMFKDLNVVIRYGLGTFPGHRSDRISDEQIFPVCSPALVDPTSLPLDPIELARHRVIRSTTPRLLRDDWPLWLETAGVPRLVFADEISCDLLYSCFELAVQGMGFVMGRTPIVCGDLKAGRLVAPFTQRIKSSSGYYLTVPHGLDADEPVQIFRNWLLNVYTAT
jgi:LysR family glycine cleavage system transcriptional activator